MCDLLWSDPTAEYGNDKEPAFNSNTSRRCSFKYSIKGVKEFLEHNNLLCIVRGHEAQDAGYRLYKSLPKSDFPSLMTVFSAPNYVDVYKNKAAIVKYDGTTFTIRQFTQASHPFYLPKFIDAFDWSLPFLSEKTAELLLTTLEIPSMSSKLPGLSPNEKARLDELKKFRERVIKSKVVAINKVAKIFHNVRNERESVDELMNVMGSKIVPHRYLSLGSQEIRELVKSFSDAKKSDCINEMLPPDDEDTSDVSNACSVTSVSDTEEPPREALEELEAALAGEQIKPKRVRTYRNSSQ
jgi:serine/threonine-protein phosphatase 2B catalytic subunit